MNTNNFLFLIIISTLYISSFSLRVESTKPNSLLSDFVRKNNELNLRDWLGKLVIDLPNDLIESKTKGYIENLTIYNITLESLITSRPERKSENEYGVRIKIRNAGINIKGKYTFLTSNIKNFLAKIYSLTIDLPFFLIKNESGFVYEVDTTGFNISIDNAVIELDLDSNELLRNIVKGILRGVLSVIKSNVIEKQVIILLNEKLADVFQFVNNIILSGIQPDELIITMDEKDRADIRSSPLLGSVSYILSNVTGANGPLSLNDIVNIFTNDTGIIHLKNIYDKEIKFEFNITNKNNISLANIEFNLDDLNISGLNTWKNFKGLEPYDSLSLYTITDLLNLTINVTFSSKVKLYKESNLVLNDSILYEKADLRANLQNNTLNAFIQLPFNDSRVKEYTNQECLNVDCVIDLVDSNGTGVTALSLNETFTYILLETKNGDDLEEDLDETVNRLTNLFITYFNEQIASLLNALLNTTVINLANQKINQFLYSKNCPGVEDPDISVIDIYYTSSGVSAAIFCFGILMFCTYCLNKFCDKKKNQNENEDKIDKIKAKYCIENISIKWMKEFGRIDPEGASLFLNPKIPLFFRIFIPLAILLTIAFFLSSNSGIGASILIVLNIGRRVQFPSLYNFCLFKDIQAMIATAWFLFSLVALSTAIWPYIKFFLMLLTFFLPTSILSHRRREQMLLFLDATGKISIFDGYVFIMILVGFHLNVDIPLSEDSIAKKGSIVNVFVSAKYSFTTLIIGTIISLCLSHIMTHLHRSLDEHPEQNKGEKAESYKSIMNFAKVKFIKDTYFRIFISLYLIITLILVIAGSIIDCFSFYFYGLAGYALDLLNIPSYGDYSVVSLGKKISESYEDPHAPVIIFTQVIYFLTVLVIPLSFLLTLFILWFIPMSRRIQKIIYNIAEILNAWSCMDVFILAIFASLIEIGQIAKFVLGDKCQDIDPIIRKYFSETLGGHDSCFEVKGYLKKGFWIFLGAALSFFINSFVILKVCRNTLNERLPEHVKEFLKMRKKEDRNSNISDNNDYNSTQETLVRVPNDEDGENNNISNNNEDCD